MEKMLVFPLLLVASCLVAGLYGALHNQISYTVAPEYFHAFKFHKFGIPLEFQNRLGAALVGWRASWWMGLVVGTPVLLVGLVVPGWKAYLRRGLVAIAIVVSITLVVGLGALAHAQATFTEANLPSYAYRTEVTDPLAFACAGTMHNYSYLGGFLGILVGSALMLAEGLRLALRGHRNGSPGGPSGSTASSVGPTR
jgi:hypothetical protein